MAHIHSVYDSDAHFSINPITRVLRNEASGKTNLIQYDHNSERFTFEIPRMIEGHDMSKCNVVRVHYINIDAKTKAQVTGVYEVDDMQVSPESDDVVICSWLISRNATQLVGSLHFVLCFSCVTNGIIDYAWNTAMYTGISVGTGIDNGEEVATQYPDVLDQWREELMSIIEHGVHPIARSNSLDGEKYFAHGGSLPTVDVNKISQVVFIPDIDNATDEPTLSINNGEHFPIRLRVSQDDMDTTIPVGMLVAGTPYVLTFAGDCWFVDSMVDAPSGSVPDPNPDNVYLEQFGNRLEGLTDADIPGVPYYENFAKEVHMQFGAMAIVRTTEEEENPGFVEVPSVGMMNEAIIESSPVASSSQTPDGRESAPLGDELASNNGWTTDGWTGDFSNGFTHTSGNTTPLEFALPIATGTNKFHVSFKCSIETTPTNIMVSLGNSEPLQLYGQKAGPIQVGIQSVSDGTLRFIPESDFVGTISNISVKQIVGYFGGIFKVNDSNGERAFEIRPTQKYLDNLFVGVNSGRHNTSGYGNATLGTDCLGNNTSGFWNIGVGYQALKNNTTGSRNIGIGYSALLGNISGNRNIAIGSFALNHNTVGCWNIAIGADCMDKNTSGNNNTALGFQAMYRNTSGSKNVAVGYGALTGNTTGGNNVGVGSQSLSALTTGSNNTGVGYGAFTYETIGHSNVGIGMNAGYKTKGGNNNVAIGINAMKGTTSAAYTRNVCIGTNAGAAFSASSASQNTLIGYCAGDTITTGGNNIMIGVNANPASATDSYKLNIGGLIKGSMNGEKYAEIDGGLQINNLPTTDPNIAGRLWNDNGAIKISGGVS